MMRSMAFRWRIYWVGLIAALLGLLWFKNKKYYPDKGWRWTGGKSILECLGLVVSAIYMPALIVAYASIWLTRNIKHQYIKLAASVIVSIPLMLMGNLLLEGLIIIGAFAIELLSSDVIRYYRERRNKRYGVSTEVARSA